MKQCVRDNSSFDQRGAVSKMLIFYTHFVHAGVFEERQDWGTGG